MSLLPGWGSMRKPKKLHHTSSKKRTRPLSTRRQLPRRSRKTIQKTSRKRAATLKATAPTISQDVQQHRGPAEADMLKQPAQAEADMLSLRSEIVRQILASGTIPVP